jgi:hypothetical protein
MERDAEGSDGDQGESGGDAGKGEEEIMFSNYGIEELWN